MRVAIGMRWWLALAFAAIGAATAVGVAQVLSARAERAFGERAEDFAVGSSLAAAASIEEALERGNLETALPDIANRRRLALFVFDANGGLITPRRSLRVDLASIPRADVLASAFAGELSVATFDNGRATVVALPLRPLGSGAVLAYASRPELAAGLGIAREKIVEAAVWATVLGGLAGLLVAVVITARLRRIAAAAAAIEGGSFDRPLRPRFRDELGALAATIDRMRVRLRDSFSVVQSERDRLHVLLERLHEGVLTVNSALEVEYANPVARDALSLDAAADVPLPDPWPALSLRGLAGGLFRPDARIVQTRVSVDDERTYEVVGIPAASGATAAVIVLTDVSERERRERAQRDFVANAAHELRTPLSVISGAIELLQGGAKEVPAERDRFLAHIERESARLRRLGRALLVLARAQSRAEPARLEPIELRPVLESIAAAANGRREAELRVECPSGLAVLAQRELAEQIVSNLVENACKHTERGEVVVAARRVEGGSVELEVSDTGAGIAPDERAAVFERFYRGESRDAEGFGLGLAIVRESVRALGGTVELESEPGRGTTVRVTLRGAESRAA